MKGKITGIKRNQSTMGGVFWYFFFKMENGDSAKSCVYERYGNAKRWMPMIEIWKKMAAEGRELWLDGLALRGRMVDADSFFSVVKSP